MFGDFVKYVAGEWEMISQAPVIFVAAVSVCTLIVWLARRSIYTGQISSLKESISTLGERIRLRDDQLRAMETSLKADTPSDALVKLGELTFQVRALSVGKWLPLTSDQLNKLRVALKELKPGKLELEMSDDARALTLQVDKVLDELGWEIEGSNVMGGGIGISVRPESDEARAMAKALETVGLEVEIKPGPLEHDLVIHFGRKPFNEAEVVA